MDFSLQISSAIQDILDVGQVYPVVYTLPTNTVEQFVEAVVVKLHKKMMDAMNLDGERHIMENDALGLSLLFIREGIKLPPDQLIEICEDIIKKSRKVARFIGSYGGRYNTGKHPLWYCKLYLDMSKDDEETYSWKAAIE